MEAPLEENNGLPKDPNKIWGGFDKKKIMITIKKKWINQGIIIKNLNEKLNLRVMNR